MDSCPEGTSVLERIFEGVSVYYNYTGKVECFQLDDDPHGMDGWNWQVYIDYDTFSFLYFFFFFFCGNQLIVSSKCSHQIFLKSLYLIKGFLYFHFHFVGMHWDGYANG